MHSDSPEVAPNLERVLDADRNYTATPTNPYMTDDETRRHRLERLRSAWPQSLLRVGITSIIGLIMGQICSRIWPGSPGAVIAGGIGAVIILWATVALLGWEIQSWRGNTLPEQVNKWVYRGACTIGTCLLVVSAS